VSQVTPVNEVAQARRTVVISQPMLFPWLGLLEQTRYQPDRARFQIPPPPERAQWAPGTPLVNEAELREKLAAGPPSTVGPVPEQDGPPSTLDQQGLPIAWVAQLGDHADSQSAAQWLARGQARREALAQRAH